MLGTASLVRRVGVALPLSRCMSTQSGSQATSGAVPPQPPRARSARPLRNARLENIAKSHEAKAAFYEKTSKSSALMFGTMLVMVVGLYLLSANYVRNTRGRSSDRF
eukprot:scpid81643/ scgid15626/ 